MIVVIHGPQRTGKTLNAEAFSIHYGCARVIDWSAHRRSCTPSQNGDLLLTTEPAYVVQRHLPNALLVSIDDARKAIGLAPVPSGSFPLDRDHPHTFTTLGFTAPFRRGDDGEIVDAGDNLVCLVDHNAEMLDDRVAHIQRLIVLALNRYEFELSL